MIRVLFFWLSSFKEVITKPNFCEMCLIFICCIYLFDSIESFCFEMEAFPHFRKSTSTKLFSF